MHWQKIINRVTDILQKWDAVEAITELIEGKNIYDTGFVIELDVYCKTIPYKKQRRQSFEFVDLYEHSSVRGQEQERLLIGEVPIHICYRLLKPIEALCKSQSRAQQNINILKIFWLVNNTNVLFSRNGIIEHLRECIANMPDGFWVKHKRVLTENLHEYLRDLRYATLFSNQYLFFCASADFTRSFISLLFCLVHKYQNPEHSVNVVLEKNNITSPELFNRLKLFLFDYEMSYTQRFKIAELLVQETATV